MRDITLEETVYFNFTTRSFSTGVPATLAGTPALSVLESNNATPITAGVSVSVDRASVTGLNQATVVATAANGYEAGKSYAVYISTGTVGGVSVVGEVVAQFTVQTAAAFTRLGAPAGASVSADVAAVKTQTAAIEVDTQDIQARIPAALVSGRIDASVGAIAANAITAAATAADFGVEVASAVWDRVLSAANHNISSSAGRRLRQLNAADITDGTAQAGASNSITLAAGESATNEIYDSNLIVITAGTGAGQSRVIVEYNGSTKVAIVGEVWVVTPDNTSEYQIIADHQSDISHHGLAQAGGATSITLATTASATDDVYNGSTVYLSTSTGSGQVRVITDYDGTTKVATVSPAWATNPGVNTVYKILPVGRVVVDSISTPATEIVADAVWDEVLSGHLTAGTTGNALNAAGAAGDPWTTALPGAYGAGTAGKIIGDNINATISSRMATYTQPTGFLAATFPGTVASTTNITAASGVTLSAVGNEAAADALLTRNVSGGSNTGRTVKQVYHFIRNKWVVAAGTLTVYDTDDTTTSWTAAVTGTAGADPVTGVDP